MVGDGIGIVLLCCEFTIWKDRYGEDVFDDKVHQNIVSPQQDTYINLVEEEFVGIVLGSEDVCA